MNNVFYVYLHRRSSDGKVFYVGKGSGKRAKETHGRNIRWKRTVEKHGMYIEYYRENLSEQEAFDLEIETIRLMRELYPETMCNMTDGGEGLSGYKWTDMTRHPYHPANRKPRTPEQLATVIRKLKGRMRSEQEIKAVKEGMYRANAPRTVFKRMVKYLLGEPILVTRDFNKLSNFNRKDFYKDITAAIKKSAASRRGKPAHNADKTEYCFFNKDTGEILHTTRRDLAIKIDSERVQDLLKQIHELLRGKRAFVCGWTLYNKEK